MRVSSNSQSILAAAAAARVSCAQPCSSEVFSAVSLRGGEILSVSASLRNITQPSIATNAWPITSSKTSLACQVTVQYTHDGWDDTINTYVWLPVADWNGRLVGVGGGGFATGNVDDLGYHVANNFAAVTTDGGHDSTPDVSWLMASPENLNWPNWVDFAYLSLDEAATLGKQVSELYYSRRPDYSYWTGCSTGGRQGHVMAQRYPTQYNGILATAPAINWDKFVVNEFYPQFAMNELGYYPPPCELEAIRQAAVVACDGLDGLVDGIVADEDACNFDPAAMIGTVVDCPSLNGTVTISAEGVEIAKVTWAGGRSAEGDFQWYGLGRAASLSLLAGTQCTSVTECLPSPFPIAAQWLSIFLLRDPAVDLSTLTRAQYDQLFRASRSQWSSIIGTSDPDLTDFKRAGGKLITWHGTADELIPLNGTADYYNRVRGGDPDVDDYYRFFVAPGIGHCWGGQGWYPGSGLDALIEWVERGVAPEALYAEAVNATTGDILRAGNLCRYPLTLTYTGGDVRETSSYTCK